jgi:hypothetical protein
MGVINAVTDVIVDNDATNKRKKILIGTSDAVITDRIDRTPIIAQMFIIKWTKKWRQVNYCSF